MPPASSIVARSAPTQTRSQVMGTVPISSAMVRLSPLTAEMGTVPITCIRLFLAHLYTAPHVLPVPLSLHRRLVARWLAAQRGDLGRPGGRHRGRVAGRR